MAEDITTKILEINVDYGDALTKIAAYRKELDDVKAKQKDLKNLLKEGSITQEEYHKSMEASKLAAGQMTSAIGTLTKQIKNQMTAQKSSEDSLVQLRAKLSNATAEYDRMSKAERDSAKGQDLKKHMNALTTSLKETEEGTQRFFRNVGNYEGAVKPLRTQLRELTMQLAEMKAAGKENTPEFQAMIAQAGNMRDAMADVTAQIGTYASDTAQLDIAVQGVSSLVNMYTIWQSVSKGVGVESEALDKIMSGIMGTMAVLNSLQQIQNALQKQSALVKGIDAAKTWLQNTALGAKIAATTAETGATTGATAATWLWNAALMANPLVWLIGIIVAAVAAVYGLIKAFSFFTSDSEKRKQALAEEAEALEDLERLHEQAMRLAEARGATEEQQMRVTIEYTKQMSEAWEKHFQKVAEEYDEDDDEYKDALDKKKKAHEDFVAALDNGLIALTKIQTEQHEWERQEALGEYVYKRTLIREQTKQQLELAKSLLKYNKITKAEYDNLVADLNKLQTRKLSEVDTAEAEASRKKSETARKAAADSAKKAEDNRKKQHDAEVKREKEYQKEFQAAQDALLAILKDGLDKQLQVETLAYERSLKNLTDRLAKYKTHSEYDIKMRIEIQTQIDALTTAHERKVTEFQFAEAQRRIKLQEEMLQAKLDNITLGAQKEEELRTTILKQQEEEAKNALKKRLDDGELTQEQYDALILELTTKFEHQRIVIKEEAAAYELELKKATLKNEIDQITLAQTERDNALAKGYEMSDEKYAEWRQRGLDTMDEYDRQALEKQLEFAQAQYDAIVEQGQLSSETEEQYEQRRIASKQSVADANKAINDKIISNEKAVGDARKQITDAAVGLLNTLGESNKTFAKISKIITLAQIAIDTGQALSSGIKSAMALPFPANIAAVATTITTVLTNIATAISTVKSAKFATGGKVNGPGTGTSDSIPAMLSNGEYVMTARATKIFEPVLAAMNGIGSGVPMQVANSAREITTTEIMADSFESAAREIKPVVSVVEITEAQGRVSMIQKLDSF